MLLYYGDWVEREGTIRGKCVGNRLWIVVPKPIGIFIIKYIS